MIASMKNILLLVTLSLLSYGLQAQPGQFLREMQVRLENSKAYTLQVAAAMPEEGYRFSPVTGEMNFSEQLLHMAGNIWWLTSAHLTGKPAPFPEENFKAGGKSKQEVLQILEKTFDYAISAVAGFDSLQLEKPVPFFAGPLTKRQVMLLIADHQTHHRGQLIVYLRLKGIKPPRYVGW